MLASASTTRAIFGVLASLAALTASGCAGSADLPPVGNTPPSQIQWILAAGAQLNAVALANATTGAVVGEFGTVLLTRDSGANWTSVDAVTRESLKAVAFGSADAGVAAGTNGAVLSSSDGGRTWVVGTSGTNATLRAAAFGSPTIAIVAGEHGTILRSDDAGKTWRSVTSGTTADLRAVRFASASSVVAAGDAGALVQSADAGLTWQSRDSGTGAALRALYFSNGTNGVAVGGDDFRWRAERVIVRTTDGGQTWSAAKIPAGKRLYAATSAGPGQIVAVGESGQAVRTTDDGQTWTETGAAVAGTGRAGFDSPQDLSNWFASASTEESTVVAVTYGGRIYKSADAGTTWTPVPQPLLTTMNLAAVARVDATTFVASSGNDILRSADGGAVTRARMAGPGAGRGGRGGGPNVMSLHFPTPAVGVGSGVAGAIVRTVDGGQSWTTVESSTQRNLRGVAFADEKVGIAVAGPAGTGAGMVRTDDGGLTWQPQACVPGTDICTSTSPLMAVALLPSQFGMAAGGTNSGPALAIRTTDGGRHWTKLNLSRQGLDSQLQALALIDERHAIAVGTNGVILQSSDGGDSWMQRDSGARLSLTGVAFADASRGLIVGAAGTILVTVDGGTTWTREAPRTTRDLWAVQFQDPNTAIITGSPGVLLRHIWTAATGRGGSHE